jgi:lipopolysaccharide/colanic/teichoic acid biosynthesis glycosyltransferase
MSVRDLTQAEAGIATVAPGKVASTFAGTPRWKRAIDLAVGLCALVVLAPVMLVAAGLIRLTSPGPVLFRQTRIGLGERPFTMFKFRSMREGAAEEGDDDRLAIARELSGDASPEGERPLFRPVQNRVTPVGALLRRMSVDELPQLFNVLRGEMSLVGPRPALPWEVDMFTAEQRRRHCRPPGMTGLWQVAARNRVSTLEMLALDLRYVDECSLWLDLGILLRTPAAVLLHQYTR